MKSISKITVQPFLNTSLNKNSSCVIDENGNEVRTYPLYFKIIFMRKTTQIRCIANSEYYTIEEAFQKDSDFIEIEKRMIEDVVSKEFFKNPNRFTLVGIAEKIKPYNDNFSKIIIDTYIWDEFKEAIKSSRTEYMRILLNRDFRETVVKYYKAALILIGNRPELIKLEERFKNLEQIQNICGKKINLFSLTILEWKYGGFREKFAQVALQKGYKFDEVNGLIDIIDMEIKKKV